MTLRTTHTPSLAHVCALKAVKDLQDITTHAAELIEDGQYIEAYWLLNGDNDDGIDTTDARNALAAIGEVHAMLEREYQTSLVRGDSKPEILERIHTDAHARQSATLRAFLNSMPAAGTMEG